MGSGFKKSVSYMVVGSFLFFAFPLKATDSETEEEEAMGVDIAPPPSSEKSKKRKGAAEAEASSSKRQKIQDEPKNSAIEAQARAYYKLGLNAEVHNLELKAESFLKAAESFKQAKNFKKAGKAYLKAAYCTTDAGKRIKAFLDAGEFYKAAQKDLKAAQAYIQRTILVPDMDQKRKDTLCAAECYMRKGEKKLAALNFTRAAFLCLDSQAPLLLNKALKLLEKGENKEEVATIYHFLGHVEFRDLQERVKNYLKAAETLGGQGKAGLCYWRAGFDEEDREKKKEYFLQAAKLFKSSGRAVFMTRAYLMAAYYAPERSEEKNKYYLELADFCEEKADKLTAAAVRTLAERYRPLPPYAIKSQKEKYEREGADYEKEGRHEEAAAAYMRVVDVTNDFLEKKKLFEKAALFYENIGKKVEASMCYENAAFCTSSNSYICPPSLEGPVFLEREYLHRKAASFLDGHITLDPRVSAEMAGNSWEFTAQSIGKDITAKAQAYQNAAAFYEAAGAKKPALESYKEAIFYVNNIFRAKELLLKCAKLSIDLGDFLQAAHSYKKLSEYGQTDEEKRDYLVTALNFYNKPAENARETREVYARLGLLGVNHTQKRECFKKAGEYNEKSHQKLVAAHFYKEAAGYMESLGEKKEMIQKVLALYQEAGEEDKAKKCSLFIQNGYW